MRRVLARTDNLIGLEVYSKLPRHVDLFEQKNEDLTCVYVGYEAEYCEKMDPTL